MKEKRVGKPRVIELLQKAAAKAAAEGDPWAKYNLPAIPAERIIRHLYHPETQTWTTDESVVKTERTPFTHGAMRHCYRMKKRATPPESATNHRFHKHGWSRALNYIAKAYHKDGEIDTSDEAKRAVQNDVMLQYEAQHWAKKFNENGPPSKILFIRAYVVEFPDREGQPWFAVERYIAGNDWYGLGFVKHNTNAGFVDTELHRVTPQVFSAYSFYASEGTRLVADIQGVGDLYTDPQVLSSDYRFGDGDLGPRGMALFFKTFRHNAISDAAGIPIFPLSKNELRVQAKYEEDEITVSDDEQSLESNGIPLDRFQLLDLNRMRRSCALKSPRDLLQFEEKDTFKRSNISRDAISDSLRSSMRMSVPPNAHLLRSKSEVTETQSCLDRARKDLAFTHHDFHRHISGELRERQYKRQLKECEFRKTTIVRKVSAPIIPTDRTVENLGKVHYQLAMLHGMGRFPETIPEIVGKSIEGRPEHDAFSVLFHLSYAASLQNSPACLALARVHAGLGTIVSGLLNSIVPIDFEAAKDLLRRAMTSSQLPNAPKAAAGCLLYQLLHDERKVRGEEIPSDNILIRTLKDTIVLIETAEDEQNKVSQHKKRAKKNIVRIHEGDRVEANYCLEGTFYPGDVLHVSDDGQNIAVRYDDDGSEETLAKEQVRLLIPPTATQTSLGGPLSDEEAFGSEQGDDKFLLQKYELQAELAALYETTGEVAAACRLYELAADAAVQNGKIQNATQWSLKAGELEP